MVVVVVVVVAMVVVVVVVAAVAVVATKEASWLGLRRWCGAYQSMNQHPGLSLVGTLEPQQRLLQPKKSS